jgi:Tfp pilus assembly protein FimT
MNLASLQKRRLVNGTLWILSTRREEPEKMKEILPDGQKGLGFTMIELLIVIAMIMIMATVAIPGFARWFPERRLKSAAQAIYTDLQGAKLGAIRANTTWAVHFDDSGVPGRYRVLSGDGGDGNWTNGNEDQVKVVDFSMYKGDARYGHGNALKNIEGNPFGNNITFTTPNKVVLFGPRGTANKVGYVYLCNDNGTAFVVGTTGMAGGIVLRKLSGTVTWR